MTEFYEVITRKYYNQDMWADTSGYEVEIVRTGKEFQSWHNQEEEYEIAVELQDMIIDGLKANNPYGYGKIETGSNGVKRLVSRASIGD